MYVLTADYQRSDAKNIFVKSLKNTGFGIIKNHVIDFELIKNVYAEWEMFFNLPEKQDYLYNKETQEGYFPYLAENAKDSDQKDLKEFYHYYTWGRYPAMLSPNTKNLRDQLTHLASEILNWIQEDTPAAIKNKFSQPLPEMIKDSPSILMRILHYPPLTGKESEGAVRAAAHEDIDLLTLLPAATAAGLQVKDIHDQWHGIECDPGAIVVNAGDMLQMCSENYYRSTTHQVINPLGEEAKKSRLSMPLFLHPCPEVKLSPKYTAQSYLNQRLKEIGIA